MELDITTDDSRIDLVTAGFDAGIQFGEFIAQDMVAVRVSPDHRPAIVVEQRLRGRRVLDHQFRLAVYRQDEG